MKLRVLLPMFSIRLHLEPGLMKGLSLALLWLLIGNFIACLWWYVSANTPGQPSWIDNPSMVYNSNMRDASLAEQYIVSLYWTGMTLFGIGYGDIVASNSDERLLNSIIMILGSTLLFGYILSSIAEIVYSIRSTKSHEGEELLTIEHSLSKRRVPLPLKSSIVNHLKLASKFKFFYNDESFVKDLPSFIQDEVQYDRNIQVLKNISIFNYISNRSITMNLFNLFKATQYDKNDYIAYEGIYSTLDLKSESYATCR